MVEQQLSSPVQMFRQWKTEAAISDSRKNRLNEQVHLNDSVEPIGKLYSKGLFLYEENC